MRKREIFFILKVVNIIMGFILKEFRYILVVYIFLGNIFFRFWNLFCLFFVIYGRVLYVVNGS